jgi:type I restriction enzyme M protein
MLDSNTKRRIDTARDILVGKVPDPKSQVEQITIALIYKFMDDMDAEAEELGGKRKFFTGDFARYGWAKLMSQELGGHEMLGLYAEGITKMPENPGIPLLFRDIFKNAYLPYRDPETLKSFLKIIDEFSYDHSEQLGDAYEYLLSILGSQGAAGQFRTPRHIIDFMVECLAPKKNETVLDPACGTAGFLISAYKHILRTSIDAKGRGNLTPDEKGRLAKNFKGYDIDPLMARLAKANLYLHGFTDPHIFEYDTLTSEERWNEFADVILANPPFMSPKGGIKPHKRFGIQAKRSEVLFVDYMAEHLTPSGRAAIIVPEGIIFQSQTAYKDLRKMLLENSLVAVVSLPAGCFNPYSGVKTSILILDKSLARQSDTIAFFKVENDGFGLGAQRRAIEKNDLPQVQAELAAYLHALRAKTSTETLLALTSTAQIVPKEKIAANGDYNLSGERYREGAVQSQTYPSYPLSEVCDIFNGSTPSKQEPRYWENGTVPWFTVEDIRKSGRIIEKTEKFVTEAGLNETSLKLLPKHSVLLCCTASVGEYAFTEIEVTTNQQFNGLVVNRAFAERLLPKYLFLISSRFKDELIRLSGKTSFNFVSVGTLKTIQIPLPPLEVQKEIVAEIEGYQKVINGARSVLDHYRPHIPIHPDCPMVSLGEISEVTSSKRILAEEYVPSGTPFYRTKEIVELSRGKDISLELFISQERFDLIKARFGAPAKGELLISAVGTIGVSWVVADDREFYFKDGNLLWIRNLSNLDPYFLKHCLDSTFAGGIDHIVFGAAYKALTIEKLKEFKIPLPPLATQQAIVAEIEAEQTLVAANRELIARFEKKIQATLARIWGEELMPEKTKLSPRGDNSKKSPTNPATPTSQDQ